VKAKKQEHFRVREFAQMASVTVRTLHHYDRIGLLRPARSGQNGYRLYVESDLGRLEQILVLRFLGLPLKQIRDLLKSTSALPSVLRRQQRVLAEKRNRLDKAIQAISAALHAMEASGLPQWNLFKVIIKEIEMQNNSDWTVRYYSDEAKARLEQRKGLWMPELQERVSREWAELFRDIEAALGSDPASARAQALAARWRKLVEGFTGGDPEIQKGLNAMYADQANWPGERKQAFGIRPEIQDFIHKALKAARQ
jgi:DNA-binding transcriptional MerR regulator